MQTVRFKSRTQTIRKKGSISPNSRYNNRLFNILQSYSKINSIAAKTKDEKFSKFDVFKMAKEEINDPYILNNCGLLQFPIRLSGHKFIETDYIEPYWDGKTNSPYYKMISKPYVLIRENPESSEVEVIESKRLEAYKEDKPVRVYKIKIPVDFEVIYEA